MPGRKIAALLVLWYLRFWAQVALAIHRPIIIGIAGSTGKTSTRQLLLAAISPIAATHATEGNSETGVPLGILNIGIGESSPVNWVQSILKAPFHIFSLKKLTYLLVEMGTDEPQSPKNMSYLLTIVQPDIAIHLNAQPVHTQQFATALTEAQRALPTEEQEALITQAIGYEDAKIITHTLARAIVNADDPVLSDVYLPLLAKQPSRQFSFFGKAGENTISYSGYAISPEGTTFTYQLDGKSVAVPLPGYVLPQHYQELVAATLLVCQQLQLNVDDCIKNMANVQLPHSRSTVLPGINQSAIIDSTYNASTAAVSDMLALLQELARQTKRPTVVLLGDMRELGGQAEIEHRKIAALLSSVDQLITVGPLTKQYIHDVLAPQATRPSVLQHFDTSIQAGEYLKNNLPQDALLLAKGSQNTIYLEEAVKMLLTSPQDAAKLCRQEEYWLKRKEKFFKNAVS